MKFDPIMMPVTSGDLLQSIGLSLSTYRKAVSSGALQTSGCHPGDSTNRLRYHSPWDTARFMLLLRCGWPNEQPTELVHEIDLFCDELAYEVQMADDVHDLLDKYCPSSAIFVHSNVGCQAVSEREAAEIVFHTFQRIESMLRNVW